MDYFTAGFTACGCPSDVAQVEREAGACVVEACPPSRGLLQECEDNLNVEVSDFLYLHNTHTFFNIKI